jgi:hypothetical protein
MGAGATGPRTAFSGVLELLKALEVTLDAMQNIAPSTNERTES